MSEQTPRTRKTKLIVAPSPPPESPVSPPPAPPPSQHAIHRAALAEQILLDALRVSWTMGTSTAESVFGSPETLAKFAVRAADGLIAALGKQPETIETKGSKQ